MPQISWREFLLWILRRRKRGVVKNRSMLPTLRPGDEILWIPGGGRLDWAVGDIVLIHHPNYPDETLIKRIVQIHPEDQMEVRGDNWAESVDSRQFGWVSKDCLVGKVTCLFSASR